MQAIILAAGMGKRLGKLTGDNTKCMVKVNGRMLIDRMLTQLAGHPLKRIVLVIGYKGEKLQEYLGTSFNRIPLIYVVNPDYEHTNNIYSLFLAKEYLREDETVLLESDIVLEDSIIEKVIFHPYPNLAVVAKYRHRMNGTMVYLDKDNRITHYIPNAEFSCDHSDEYYKTVNVYKFSKQFSSTRYIPFLEAYIQAFGHNEYYEQVLSVLSMLDNTEVKGLPLDTEKWVEIDDLVDLEHAETLFHGKEDTVRKYQSYYGGYWRFPSLIDYCYLVNPFFPTDKLKQLMVHNFETLLCQYPSGMKSNVLSVSNYFNIDEDYICVGNGAAELIKVLIPLLQGKVGTLLPSFEEYAHCIGESRNISFRITKDNFSYGIKDVISFFEDKDISNLILVNPENPSGNFIRKEDLLYLLEWCTCRNIHLVVDESFLDFSDGFDKDSLLRNEILKEYTHLIVLKSISKSYGVPGLRLGVLASGNGSLVKQIRQALPIWNINSFADFFMQNLCFYKDDYKSAHLSFLEERQRFYNELKQIRFIRPLPSQANYFLCEVYGFSAFELTSVLLHSYNLFIKDCSSKKGFEGRQFVRLAIKGKEENDLLINSLKLLDKEYEKKHVSSVSG